MRLGALEKPERRLNGLSWQLIIPLNVKEKNGIHRIVSNTYCSSVPGSATVLAPPKWLATTLAVASEAGQATRVALATAGEATVATAGAREEEDTEVARGVAIGKEEEEGGPEGQAVATEAAGGIREGAGGSYRSSVKSPHLDKSVFPSRIPFLLLAVCLPRQFPRASVTSSLRELSASCMILFLIKSLFLKTHMPSISFCIWV